MKILLIAKNFPPTICGVGDYTHLLAKELKCRGHQPIILTSTNNGGNKASDENLEVYREIHDWNIKGIGVLLKWVKKIAPDVLSLQYVPSGYGRYGIHPYLLMVLVLSKLSARFKIVTTFHETAIHWGPPRHWILSFIQRLQVFFMGCISNGSILTIDRREGAFKKLFFWKRRSIHKIRVGSNIPTITCDDETRTRLCTKLAPNHEMLLTTFGFLQKAKNYEQLLELLKRTNDSQEFATRLILIGKSEPMERRIELEKLAKKMGLERQITWTGFLPAEEVSQYLAVSDIFLFFHQGGASTRNTTLATAFAHGLPIIANRGFYTDGFFTHGHNVYLVDDEIESGYRGLHTLLKSNELRSRLGKNAQESFRRLLSWTAIGDQYEGTFQFAVGLERKLGKTEIGKSEEGN